MWAKYFDARDGLSDQEEQGTVFTTCLKHLPVVTIDSLLNSKNSVGGFEP